MCFQRKRKTRRIQVPGENYHICNSHGKYIAWKTTAMEISPLLSQTKGRARTERLVWKSPERTCCAERGAREWKECARIRRKASSGHIKVEVRARGKSICFRRRAETASHIDALLHFTSLSGRCIIIMMYSNCALNWKKLTTRCKFEEVTALAWPFHLHVFFCSSFDWVISADESACWKVDWIKDHQERRMTRLMRRRSISPLLRLTFQNNWPADIITTHACKHTNNTSLGATVRALETLGC